MTTRRVLWGCLLILVPLALSAQQAHYQKHGDALLPDDGKTPGNTTPSDTQKICMTKWGADERFVTAAMKKQVYALYGTAPGQGVCKYTSHTGKNGATVTKGCEIDHRVSREVGGTDTVDNLWPQPYLTPEQPGAYQKDKLENWLHKQVCMTHKMTLAEAQQALKGDWYAAYLKAGLDK
jgi:hypothetical protein